MVVSWKQLWQSNNNTGNITASVRDLWKHEDLGQFTNQFQASVEPHGVVMIRVTNNSSSLDDVDDNSNDIEDENTANKEDNNTINKGNVKIN